MFLHLFSKIMNIGNLIITVTSFIFCTIENTQGVAIRQKRDEDKSNSKEVNPMITEDLFEGDIRGIVPEDIHGLVERSNTIRLIAAVPGTDSTKSDSSTQNGAAVSEPFKIWPNKQLFYKITNDFTTVEKKVIRDAMEEYHEKTCIKMIPRTNQTDYVVVRKLKGCNSHVGRQSGRQELSLADGCVDHGKIVHEFMHALGFFHEQSRWDRDKFVKVHLENVEEKKVSNFDKYELDVLKNLNTPYDFKSVMHYGKYDFSINDRPTIVPLKKGIKIGQRLALSDIDVLEIRRLYNCDNAGPPVVNPVNPINPGNIQSGFRIVDHYTQYIVENASECQEKCEAEIQCHAMTFDSGSTYSFANCFLSKSGFKAVEDKAWSAWSKSGLHPGSIRLGIRIENYYKSKSTDNVNQCKKLCQVDKRCAAMTYDSTNSYSDDNCFLCNASYSLITAKHWSSWMKGNLQPGVRFTVKPYRGLRNYKTLVACVQKCEMDSRCQGMNFYNGNYDSEVYGNCFLYEARKDYGKEKMYDELEKWTAWVKGVL